jgi:hypothetical protein
MPRLTPAQAQAFAERWAQANQAEVEELRASSPDLALRQLDSLRSAVDLFGWQADLDQETEEVRSRWNRLRAYYRARAHV